MGSTRKHDFDKVQQSLETCREQLDAYLLKYENAEVSFGVGGDPEQIKRGDFPPPPPPPVLSIHDEQLEKTRIEQFLEFQSCLREFELQLIHYMDKYKLTEIPMRVFGDPEKIQKPPFPGPPPTTIGVSDKYLPEK